MAGTQVRMDRSTITVSGTNKYQMYVTCLVKGTLPDVNIFLLDINDVVDPKNDTLARVIQIADIDTYGTDRDTVIANGESQFRSSSLTLVYDNIDTANAAQKELKARINTLVQEVDTYLEEFETANAGEVTVYPTVDPSIKTERISVYEATLPLIEAAEDARNTHVVLCNGYRTELGYIDRQLSDTQADVDALLPVQAAVAANLVTYQSVYGTISGERTVIRSFNNLSTATPAEKANIESQLVGMDAQLTAFGTNNTQLSTQSTALLSVVSSLQGRLATLNSERNILLSKLNKCSLESIELQAAVDAARTASNEALASVLAVCPDYVPGT